MLAIKARSIDVVKNPKEVFRQETEKLKKEFKILDKRVLDPFEKDHMFFLMKMKAH